MDTIRAGDLDVAYLEYGSPDGAPVILLHGFPYDVASFDEVASRLAENGVRCLTPYLRGFGPTRFADPRTMRSGQQAALAHDLLAFMDALSIPRAVLGGFDWGGRAACIVAALWPDRVTGLVSCGEGYNIQDIPNASQPAPAAEETRYWYMYYFNTRRGEAGLSQNRYDICRHIWSLWSPTWSFDQSTFNATAASFENPDFVEVVIHSYTHRFGDTPGDPRFNDIETRLSARPDITVPAIVLQGRDDGVDPPTSEDLSQPHFAGDYRRIVTEGAGHNFPQEAPAVFADAVVSLI